MCVGGNDTALRRGAFDAAGGAGRTISERLRSDRHDAKGLVRLSEAQVRT